MDRNHALPHLIEIPPLLRVRAADRNHAKPALAQPRGERAPAFGGPLLVAEHRRGMDHGIVLARSDSLRLGRRRADHLRHARDAERVGEPQHLLDLVDVRRHRRAAVKHRPLEPAAELRSVLRDQPRVPPSRQKRKQRRPVAGLGRHREVVALEQLQRELQRLPALHDDDPIDVRIALDDPPGSGQHQHVDRRTPARPGAGCGSAAWSAAGRRSGAAISPGCAAGRAARWRGRMRIHRDFAAGLWASWKISRAVLFYGIATFKEFTGSAF